MQSQLPTNVDRASEQWANAQLNNIEERMDSDVLALISPILGGLEHACRVALDGISDRRDTLLVILDTSGGVVEVVERIVRVLRHHYGTVNFLVPDRAMSAGTVLALSGNAIYMDYHSCLGPIDPQIEREGKLVPALSYLVQYEALIDRANKGELSTAEVVLLNKLDLAELHQFELAYDLSITLLERWLVEYKFADWDVTEERELEVTEEMKRERATEIGEKLNDQDRWQTHGRGIDMQTLERELKLKIDDFGADDALRALVWDYFWFLRDHMARNNITSFLHTRVYF